MKSQGLFKCGRVGGWQKSQYRSDSVLVWERLIQCLLVLKMAESQEARKAVIFRSQKRQEKGFSLESPQKKLSPANTLILAQQNLFLLSNLQNCKIIYLFIFVYLLPQLLGCSMWDLVPQPGITPGPPALGACILPTGPPGKLQYICFKLPSV